MSAGISFGWGLNNRTFPRLVSKPLQTFIIHPNKVKQIAILKQRLHSDVKQKLHNTVSKPDLKKKNNNNYIYIYMKKLTGIGKKLTGFL